MNPSRLSEASTGRGALTIAIADDVPEIQMLASTWLTAEGHRVLCAADGAQLLEIVRLQPVDVVITDVMMPESDGFEVIRELRRLHPQVRIITISGGASVMPLNDCLRVAKALGAHAVLAKPLTRSKLSETLAGLYAA